MRRSMDWLNDCRGSTPIEYALIAAIVAVGLIGEMQSVGGNLKSAFATVANGLSNGGSDSAPPVATTNVVRGGG